MLHSSVSTDMYYTDIRGTHGCAGCGVLFNVLFYNTFYAAITKDSNDLSENQICTQCTVEPLYYGHQGGRNKCPHYGGVRFREVGFIWISVS